MKAILFVIVILATISAIYCAPQGSGDGACLTHRRREIARNNSILLIPECNEDGTYKAQQCHPPSVGGKRFCQCWSPTGDVISSPSTKTKSCSCLLKRHDSRRNIPASNAGAVGTNEPQCEDDGSFKKVQCNGSIGSCWCVNPLTGVKTSDKPNANSVCP